MSYWQSLEEHIIAEYPIAKAFIATHPYFCTVGAFAIGFIVGHFL